jgi:predicted transglutaminase-like cysteine proteinase
MRVLRGLFVGLATACSLALATALPLPEWVQIEPDQIAQIADTIGQDEAQRQLIRRRLTGWKSLVESHEYRARDDLSKLKLVNDFLNETPFMCDAAQWCVEDYWATPIEFLANHGGDCEDFAIAKFVALRALGVEDARLRLVYARIRREGAAGSHVVLAYYPAADAEPLLLDNLDGRILPASQRTDLTPLLSFNAQDIRRERQNAVRVGEDALARWNGLWRASQQDQSIRFLTPAQREAPRCRRLRARAAWCT